MTSLAMIKNYIINKLQEQLKSANVYDEYRPCTGACIDVNKAVCCIGIQQIKISDAAIGGFMGSDTVAASDIYGKTAQVALSVTIYANAKANPNNCNLVMFDIYDCLSLDKTINFKQLNMGSVNFNKAENVFEQSGELIIDTWLYSASKAELVSGYVLNTSIKKGMGNE